MVSSKSIIASVLHSAATQLNILSVTHVMTEGWYLKFKCIYSYNARHYFGLQFHSDLCLSSAAGLSSQPQH